MNKSWSDINILLKITNNYITSIVILTPLMRISEKNNKKNIDKEKTIEIP